MMRGRGIGGILVGLWVFWGTSVWAQAPDLGVIESPSAFVSGIGFISGWKCNSNDITLKVLCSPYIHDLDPAQNMLRADTREVCDGRIDNGWIIQVNWEHWAGCTEVTALDNGQQFASRKFTVGEIGDGFIRDHEGTQIRVPGFPSPDQVTHFTWSTATQHFEGMYTTDCGLDDACPGSGEGDDGNNDNPPPGNPPVPYPEMQIVDGAYAGDQALVQYKGMLALPPPTYQEALVRGDSVTYHSTISYSTILEPASWMTTGFFGGSEILIPKEDLPERLDEVRRIYSDTPLFFESSGLFLFNFTGVGGGMSVYEGDDLTAEVRVNRPELAYKGGEWDEINIFVNKDTAEIGYKLTPTDLDKAGDGWLSEIRGNARCDGRQSRQGDWAVRACEEVIKTRDAWFAKVLFPNQGRGPWRSVQRWRVARLPGRYFSPVQASLSIRGLDEYTTMENLPFDYASFFTDLTGTGKLEMIHVTHLQYNAWRDKDDLSKYLTPKFEMGSVVD